MYRNVCIRKGVFDARKKDEYICWMAADAFENVYGKNGWEKIEIRKRQPGDYIYISMKDGLHRKKLQDLLVDMKIHRIKRDELMMAAMGSEILCILPNNDAGLEKPRFTAAYRAAGLQDEHIIYLANL